MKEVPIPLVYLSLDLKGTDPVFISNVYRYHSGLCTLEMYRRAPPPLPSTEQVKAMIDSLQLAYEGGKTGNHAQVALRKQLRKEVTEMFQKILHYLQSVATKEDIPALIQAGFTIRQLGFHRKTSVAPA